ncbi:MAG TPA: MBL fold metallo-hydrolase [Spirochaetota bacterium]|nr:MBL fold metallo-hydrolase [Spirochaetota bacterium]
MKITTLIDNVVYGKNLFGEHGFSLLIETDELKILFDTGRSGIFADNAKTLGIDISEIDALVISHGHYDHTGGIEEFVKRNDKASIYIKREALFKKYKSKKEYIGIPFDVSKIKKRLVFIKENAEIAKGFFIIPDIKIYNNFDTHFKNMYILNEENEFIEDNFLDEQFLVIKNGGKINIVSGCSHRGITNIVKTAGAEFNLPIDYALGGYHLSGEDDATTDKVIDALKEFDITHIGASHCTGIDKYLSLKNKIVKSNVFYNWTGNTIQL